MKSIDKETAIEFVKVVEMELKALFNKISNTSSFTDYNIFSEILIAKGSELKIKRLTYLGKAINEAVKKFDLDAISRLIKEYKVLEKSILEISNQ